MMTTAPLPTALDRIVTSLETLVRPHVEGEVFTAVVDAIDVLSMLSVTLASKLAAPPDVTWVDEIPEDLCVETFCYRRRAHGPNGRLTVCTLHLDLKIAALDELLAELRIRS